MPEHDAFLVEHEVVGHGWIDVVLADSFADPVPAWPPLRCEVEAVATFWPLPVWDAPEDVSASLRYVARPDPVVIERRLLPDVVHVTCASARAGIMVLGQPYRLGPVVDAADERGTVTFNFQANAYEAHLTGASSAVVRGLATFLATMCDGKP